MEKIGIFSIHYFLLLFFQILLLRNLKKKLHIFQYYY